MKVSSLKATAFFAVAALVATAKIASAAPLASADDAKCRATVAKNATKLATTISKAFDGCIKTGVKNGAGACNTTAAADTKVKVPGAKTKLLDGIANSCTDVDQAIPLAEHQLCGTPIGGPAITTFAGVGLCLQSLVDANVERWRNAILNPNYAGALADTTKAQGKCINAIAKNATKLLGTIQKEQSKAQNASDKLLGDSNYVNPGDPGGKIGAAVTKLSDGITKACQAVEDDLGGSGWANVRSCDDDLAGVIACVTNKTKALAEGVTASSYDQPGTCPSAVEVKIHHGGQGGADLGATELDVGHTGFGHNADVIDDFIGAVDITCGVAPNDCTACSATVSCDEGNCRCDNDTAISCTAPFTQDVCGAGNTCVVVFGPPLPLSAAGTPTCVVNQIQSELVNIANIATGESDTTIDNVAIVHLGISQAQPCPTCSAGVCDGGSHDGDPCTVNGTSPFGDLSYDCPPDPLDNISGSGLQITLNLTDDAISMPFNIDCDPPLGALDCACSTCNGDNTVPCNSNAECVGFGGTCRTDGLHGGATRVPNACNDGTCDDQGGEEGECSGTGPTDTYCDGFLKGNGKGIVTCSTNADCDAGVVGVDAGDCTLTDDRPCFLNPIDADGTPGSEGAVLVSNFCSAPTASGAVNGAAGTPGPARLALDFEFVGRCSDGSIWGPGGGNCQ
jgi:hypothetical protein